jgi:hypothetical protein
MRIKLGLGINALSYPAEKSWMGKRNYVQEIDQENKAEAAPKIVGS